MRLAGKGGFTRTVLLSDNHSLSQTFQQHVKENASSCRHQSRHACSRDVNSAVVRDCRHNVTRWRARQTVQVEDGFIRDGEKGVWRWGEREIIYLSLHCHHQNDSCIKLGSDESHFDVSVGSDGQSHRTVSTNHNLV